MPRTEYIILRKTPFRDTSLIVAGISPDFGRMDFMLKGARSLSAKKFPHAELFRELHIDFKEPKTHSGLFSMSSHESLTSHDAIALKIENYLAACEFSLFLLRHSHPMLEMPMTYRASCTLFTRLESVDRPEPWISFAKLAFLYEGGFLPDIAECGYLGEQRAGQKELFERLLDCAVGDAESETLEISRAYLDKFIAWINALMIYHSLK